MWHHGPRDQTLLFLLPKKTSGIPGHDQGQKPSTEAGDQSATWRAYIIGFTDLSHQEPVQRDFFSLQSSRGRKKIFEKERDSVL